MKEDLGGQGGWEGGTFSYELFSAKLRFETEEKGSSKILYWLKAYIELWKSLYKAILVNIRGVLYQCVIRFSQEAMGLDVYVSVLFVINCVGFYYVFFVSF